MLSVVDMCHLANAITFVRVLTNGKFRCVRIVTRLEVVVSTLRTNRLCAGKYPQRERSACKNYEGSQGMGIIGG